MECAGGRFAAVTVRPCRTENEVLAVTVTCADDPTSKMAEGEVVEFAGLTVGVMPPAKNPAGHIRGGKLFWQAAGVRSRAHAAASRRATYR